jgi:hypothetical protein
VLQVLLLQRGFAQLRLRYVARRARVHGESSQQEAEAHELESCLQEQASSYEAMIERMKAESEHDRTKREAALKAQIVAEQRRETGRRSAALVKDKVEAARREVTEQVSEHFNTLIEEQQREIAGLRAERQAALIKAEMYKARVPRGLQ